MYLCYIDESGTPEIPGNTSHFVLAGLSMPIWHWRDADREITQVLARYGLADQEFHTAALPGASTMASSTVGMADEAFTSKIQSATCLS